MTVPPSLAVLVPLLMQFECGPTVAQLAASGNLLSVFDGVAVVVELGAAIRVLKPVLVFGDVRAAVVAVEDPSDGLHHRHELVLVRSEAFEVLRRAELRGDLRHGNVFAVEDTVAVVEGIHELLSKTTRV